MSIKISLTPYVHVNKKAHFIYNNVNTTHMNHFIYTFYLCVSQLQCSESNTFDNYTQVQYTHNITHLHGFYT